MFRGDQKTLNKSRHWEESIRRVHAIHPPQVGLWNAAEGRLLSHSPQRPTLEKQILSAESSLPSFWAARSAWAFFFSFLFSTLQHLQAHPELLGPCKYLGQPSPPIFGQSCGSHGPHRDGCHVSTSWGSPAASIRWGPKATGWG